MAILKKPKKAQDMIKSSLVSPIIATSNGWTPISFFDFQSFYALQQRFLIWMADTQGNEWFEVGRAERGTIIREWRSSSGASLTHDERKKERQLAFRLIEGPDRRALSRIKKRCADHFPPRKPAPVR